MVDEAKKLGVDFGDLTDYGFEYKSSACGGKTCFNKDKLKNFDDIINKNTLTGKFVEQGHKLLQRASCHPKIQKHIPIVKSIFSTYPLA